MGFSYKEPEIALPPIFESETQVVKDLLRDMNNKHDKIAIKTIKNPSEARKTRENRND